MNKQKDLQELANILDTTSLEITGNFKIDVPRNKKIWQKLSEKYPNTWESTKELIYWHNHKNEKDFVEKQFCPCGNRTAFSKNDNAYRKYCCPKCASLYTREKFRETSMQKYGTKHPSQCKEVLNKQKKTNLEKYGKATQFERKEIQGKSKSTIQEKYGVQHISQVKEIKQRIQEKLALQKNAIQEKLKKTNLQKYGVEQYLESEEAQERIEKTNIDKYGCKNVFENKNVQEKIKATIREKYGVDYIGCRENFSLFTNRKHIKHIDEMNKEGLLKFVENHRFNIEKVCAYFNIESNEAHVLRREFYPECPSVTGKQHTQYEIGNFLEQYTSVENNNRSRISPLELDIVLPFNNIAVEYNGLLYHSFGISNYSFLNNAEAEKSCKNKHLIKTQLCEKQGLHLFQIFEDEWLDATRKEIWKSLLLNAIGKSQKLYGRKTQIREVSCKDKTEFLEKNHLQGTCISSINLGLYYQEELVSLMTFGKPRFNKEYEWELLRFCNKINTSVVGGASKLLKHFIKEHSPKSIISYANRRWSQGNLYEKLGFNTLGSVLPNYFYFLPKERKLYSRIKFQKHKLNEMLQEFDPSLSETQNMYNNGYRKIYDCGNLVYSWKAI